MIDENAFGILVSDHNLEEDEYANPPEAFEPRLRRFQDAVFDYVAQKPLASDTRALDLGHAVFFEFGEGEQSVNPIGWLRGLREALQALELESIGVLTHGSRWVPEDAGPEQELMQRFVGSVPVASLPGPSEPLRRALYAETASRPTEQAGLGWGPGLYVDTEALDSLGLAPKNQPTGLEVAGATFYRVSR